MQSTTLRPWLFAGLFLFLVVRAQIVSAQIYDCGLSCCGVPHRCNNTACTLGCVPACPSGTVSGLTYTGTNDYEIILSWNGTDATSYRVQVSSGGTSVVDRTTGDTSFPFTSSPGATYTWSVTPRNGTCPYGTPVAGSTIGVPNGTTSSVTLTYGEATSCTNTGCNTRDLIVGLDTNHNQLIPVRVVFTDPTSPATGRFTDLARINIILDNDSDYDETAYRVVYTDTGANGYTLTIDKVEGGVAVSTSDITIEAGHSRSRDAGFTTLTLDFTLNVSGFPAAADLLSNIYLNGIDFSGISTGRVLKVGTGDFALSDTGYTGSAANSLDIWNGRDVAVSDVGFYITNDISAFCAQSDLGEAAATVPELSATYSPNTNPNWLNSLTNWETGSYYQPYYYYDNNNNIATFAPTNPDYYIYALTTERYGTLVPYPTCRSTVNPNGSIDNIFLNGGVRVGDSGMGDNSLQTAFALMPVADSWSQVVDGSAFVNNSMVLNIEPLTCSSCFFSTRVSAVNNGVLLVNGDLNTSAEAEDQIGSPRNWSASTNALNKPFTSFEINSYPEIKSYFGQDDYIEYSGNQTISDTGIGGVAIVADQTYFIDGDLTVESATALRAATGEFLMIVVNGNIVITEEVKDLEAQSGIEAILIALDNGTGTGNITIDDDSAETDEEDQLTIEGSLIAAGNIVFNRSLVHNNNLEPAVKIVFRPDMLAGMQSLDLGIIDIQKTLVNQN